MRVRVRERDRVRVRVSLALTWVRVRAGGRVVGGEGGAGARACEAHLLKLRKLIAQHDEGEYDGVRLVSG